MVKKVLQLNEDNSFILEPSGQALGATKLEVGKIYLHNGLYNYRKVVEMDDKRVHYHDLFYTTGCCTKAQFVKICPYEATKEEVTFLDTTNPIPIQEKILKLDNIQKSKAKVLAIFVRNAMEDFHVKYLSDERMEELNPIIRNAIATGLHAMDNANLNKSIGDQLNWSYMCIPDYWEEPELLEQYVEVIEKSLIES